MSVRLRSPVFVVKPEKKPASKYEPTNDAMIPNPQVIIRSDLKQLRDELKGHRKVWVIWHEGILAAQSGELSNCQIDRLILTDPKDINVVKRYSERWKRYEEITDEDIQLRIRGLEYVANMAKDKGTTVHHYSGFTSCTLILADTVNLTGDDFSEKAWARIETGIPFDDTNNRFNVIITKYHNPKQFEALRLHFKSMWDNSRLA